jgi:hypothetical protein
LAMEKFSLPKSSKRFGFGRMSAGRKRSERGALVRLLKG